jgi:hypothetical protein
MVPLLAFLPGQRAAYGQAHDICVDEQSSDAGDSSGLSNPSADPATPASSTQPSPNTPSRTESDLFAYFYMTGKTQAEFEPLTAGERVRFYAKGLFGPFQFLAAASAAGITQWEDVPKAWGQGAQGYGHRFGSYFAKQTTQRTLRLGLEELLHEDNRYFTSGEHGFGRRVLYALERSVLARKDDGTSRISVSQIGSTAGASFISRLWQPASNNSAGDGAVSFGFSMASNAGLNVVREFLPDVTRHLLRRHQIN